MTLSDRLWINQYDPAVLGMNVYVRGQIGDPDANLVQVTMVDERTGAPVFTNRAATRAVPVRGAREVGRQPRQETCGHARQRQRLFGVEDAMQWFAHRAIRM